MEFYILYKLIIQFSTYYMQMKKMAIILGFIYIVVLFFSLFLLVTDAYSKPIFS